MGVFPHTTKKFSNTSCVSYNSTDIIYLETASDPTGEGLTPARLSTSSTSDANHKSRSPVLLTNHVPLSWINTSSQNSLNYSKIIQIHSQNKII